VKRVDKNEEKLGRDPLNDTVKYRDSDQYQIQPENKEPKIEEEEVREQIDEQEEFEDPGLGGENVDIEDGVDEEQILKQQEEVNEIINNEEEVVSHEDEEGELEEYEKMAKENKYDDVEVEDEEDGIEISSNEENMVKDQDKKFELNYTVGRIEDGAAILLSKDHNLIEIPL
jgi:hypothetical protein